MADNLKIVLGTKQEWEAGILPPQVDSITNPGFVQMYRPSLSFTRASTAYLPDGTQVASGLARYWWGRYQNLLTAAGANLDTSPDGWDIQPNAGCWGTFTCTRSTDTVNKVEGVASQKFVLNGTSGNGGVRLVSVGNMMNITPGHQYTYSISAKADRTMTGSNILYAYFRNASGSVITEVSVNSVTLDQTWRRISGTITPPAGTVRVELCSFAYDTCTIWLDAAQFEEGGLTDWRLGGTGKAIMIEEGTTNLLTANQSDVETDTTGFGVVGSATIARTTTQSRSGTASLQINTAAVAVSGITLSPGVVNDGVTKTFSVYVKGTAGVVVGIQVHGTVVTFTLSGGWDRLAVTGPSMSNTSVSIFTGNGASPQIATTLYVDGIQVEAKPYATSWTLGGTTRNVETLTMPTTGLSQTQGTIEFWVKPSSAALDTTKLSSGSCLFANTSSILANRWDMWLSTSGKSIGLYNGVASKWLTATTPAFQPDTMHHVAVTWHNVNGTKLYVDGQPSGTDATMTTMPTLSGTLYWGYYPGSAQAYNSDSLFDDVRISTVERSAAEILAAYNATAPLTADSNTLALFSFDNSLTSSYPASATIVTKTIDIGIIHAAPLDLTAVATTPIGTSVKLKRYRTSKDGINWNEWSEINE